MTKLFIFLLSAAMILISGCTPDQTANSAEQKSDNDNLVFVEGGSLKNKDESVSSFYIGKYEVTQQEWVEVMGSNPSAFTGDQLPVQMVSWYDAVEYCNQRSIKEGLTPYYDIDKEHKDTANINDHDNVKWTLTVNEGADGYRLPTEAEWEYAASGGEASKGYTYSGSSNADEVAWYWRNAGDKYLSGDWNWPIIESNKNTPKPIGKQKPNELGIYDMSGNVREWCWDWYEGQDFKSGMLRVVKGGGWIGDVSNNEITFRGKFDANGFGPDQGFRVVRSE